MKPIHLTVVAVIATVALIALLRSTPDPESRSHRLPAPWEVAVTHGGKVSEVLGIRLGEASLDSARAKFGGDLQIALIEQADGSLSLEAYSARVEAEFVTGALVLTTSLDPTRLQEIRSRASKPTAQPSGARRWALASDDQAFARTLPVTSLTFIPAIRLDEVMVTGRFGPTAARIPVGTSVHYQYPAIGLDITVEDSGRSVLQYVAPADFARLAMPLENAPEKAAAAS